MTQRSKPLGHEETAKRKTAFGRVSLLPAWDKWDIRDTIATTQRYIITLQIGHGLLHLALCDCRRDLGRLPAATVSN